MKTAIISAFPACGKTHMAGTFSQHSSEGILDLDSSKYSWILDEDGNSTGVRNPDFPANYIKHIKASIGEVAFILVSSHEEVHQALEDSELAYVSVMPDPSLKAEWIGRCWLRGSSEGFLKLIETKWVDWTNPVMLQQKWSCIGRTTLQSGEYLSDKLWFLETFRR